jgi:small-conductance mechanosensitive channel
MTERRALFSIALSYENTPALLEQVPKLIEAAVRSHPGTIFGYCLLQQIGDAALSYQVYFQVQHHEAFDLVLAIDAVNRRILNLFHQAGVQLAHPMHVIHVHDRAAAGAISHALATERAGQTS